MSLGSLYSELNVWNGRVNELTAKIKKLRKRRSDVDNVKSVFASTVNSNSGDVNSRIRASAGRLDNAIDYSGKDAQLHSILSGKDERTISSDNHLSSANSELQNELNAVDNQIVEAENELAQARRKVGEIEAEIAAEIRRQEAASRAAAEAAKSKTSSSSSSSKKLSK